MTVDHHEIAAKVDKADRILRRLSVFSAILLTVILVTLLVVNIELLTTTRAQSADNAFEIQQHRARDLQSLCSSELHHHATLEAVLAISRAAGIDVSGFHVDVDEDVQELCEDSDLTPPFGEEIDRIHREAKKVELQPRD